MRAGVPASRNLNIDGAFERSPRGGSRPTEGMNPQWLPPAVSGILEAHDKSRGAT